MSALGDTGHSPPLNAVGEEPDEILVTCPWPICDWGYLSPDEAAAADALDCHQNEKHDDGDDPDAAWERMQDEGVFPSWI